MTTENGSLENTAEKLARDLFSGCQDDDFFFQCQDIETEQRFCYLWFTEDLMMMCPYADSKVLVKYQGRMHYGCKAKRKEKGAKNEYI